MTEFEEILQLNKPNFKTVNHDDKMNEDPENDELSQEKE